MNGTTISSNVPITAVADLNWSIAGTVDFDGDGKSDILWRNGATGDNSIWLMNGATTLTGSSISAVQGSAWSIVR